MHCSLFNSITQWRSPHDCSRDFAGQRKASTDSCTQREGLASVPAIPEPFSAHTFIHSLHRKTKRPHYLFPSSFGLSSRGNCRFTTVPGENFDPQFSYWRSDGCRERSNGTQTFLLLLAELSLRDGLMLAGLPSQHGYVAARLA